MTTKVVDGTTLYHNAIRTIDALRKRVNLIERAFTAYVTDDLEKFATDHHEKQSPPILGFCISCGFPVYESDMGNGGKFHYTGGRYQSSPIVCGSAQLPD